MGQPELLLFLYRLLISLVFLDQFIFPFICMSSNFWLSTRNYGCYILDNPDIFFSKMCQIMFITCNKIIAGHFGFEDSLLSPLLLKGYSVLPIVLGNIILNTYFAPKVNVNKGWDLHQSLITRQVSNSNLSLSCTISLNLCSAIQLCSSCFL